MAIQKRTGSQRDMGKVKGKKLKVREEEDHGGTGVFNGESYSLGCEPLFHWRLRRLSAGYSQWDRRNLFPECHINDGCSSQWEAYDWIRFIRVLLSMLLVANYLYVVNILFIGFLEFRLSRRVREGADWGLGDYSPCEFGCFLLCVRPS
jgi:hypothetical protein